MNSEQIVSCECSISPSSSAPPLQLVSVVCSNRVTRDGVRHLAKVLKQNLTLEIVDLSSNRIEDEGALYLSEAIAWPGCVLRE